jgi:hypothetical protein
MRKGYRAAIYRADVHLHQQVAVILDLAGIDGLAAGFV